MTAGKHRRTDTHQDAANSVDLDDSHLSQDAEAKTSEGSAEQLIIVQRE